MKVILFNQIIFQKRFFSFLCFVFISLQIIAQPANDNCTAPTIKTSSTNCTTSTYTLNAATASAGVPAGCLVGTHYDVWFQFTAISSTHTATISSLGTNFTNPEIQLFSGTCAGLTSIICGTTTLTATGLIIGNTYFLRVSNVGTAIAANGGFKLCITHPGAPPSNDECTGAISLTSATSCSNTQYSMRYAAISSGIPVGCAAVGLHYDVWFMFTAVSATHTVTIGNLGADLTNPEMQLYSGTCGSLTSIICGTNTLTGTGLTIGNTYYVRVSNIGTMPTTSTTNSSFNICLTHPNPPPANDDCGGATLLTSGNTCSTTTGNLRYATSNGPAGGCGTGVTAANTFDVWYKFVAVNAAQTVTIGNLGANLTGASTYMQVLSGTCGALASLACQTVSTTNGRVTVTGLTVGTTYYVRVYVLLSPTASATTDWNFNICVQNPPANDECAGAINLVSGATCTATSGTMDLSTPSAGIPAGCVPAGSYDVWYKFTASAVSHTITLNGLGSNILPANVRIQVLGGTCGTLVSLGCVNATTLTQAALIPGTVYYVRIAYPTNPSGIGTAANFNICITTVSNSAPSNDLCSGAILLVSGNTCTNISGTLINATATASLPACGNAASPEVWYMFVAKSAYPIITLSSVGANLTTATPRIQLFTGTCGALTQVTGACVASPLNALTTPGGAGLTVGATYYVRITTMNLAAPVTTGTYTFNICITDPLGAIVDYGKSYVNLTTGTAGGTINPNDLLQIRATLVIRQTSAAGKSALDSLAYYDTLSAGKGFALMPDSMALRTNEGKLFRPSNTTKFTDAQDLADAAWITTAGAGTDTAIQMNMGVGATVFARGRLGNTHRPSNFGNTCIIMATYIVKVNAAYGTKIDYGGGAFKYRDSATGVFYSVSFPKDTLMVYASPGACPDATSPTNVVGDEFNGTFGVPAASAGSQNRGTSPNTSYLYLPFSANTPNDYYYGVANNTSAAFTTVQTVAKPNAARVFNLWDITGDHTGAANTAKGNPPCDPTKPISATNPCGYMIAINSSYHTDAAFEFNVNGACTETYYEISAWIKNICYKCGCDSNGIASTSANYKPTDPGDSSGVRPNIAFQIDGVDYYTTGDLYYQGLGGTQTGSDTLNKWVKRSFVYKTSPTQSGFRMTFRNNAPGGGGNDWVMDDISIRTCYPNMTYSPSTSPSVCAGRTIKLTDTVRSYYNVYIYYKWQRSINGGTTWVDIPGTNGVASPTMISVNNYQYINSYTLPPSFTTVANNGNLYRMVVATNATNLASSCNYSDVTPVVITVLNNCIDIDDDNDGIPDYVEFNNPIALQDANGNGIPNWNDPTYPGFVDNNADGVNDNFDYGADSNDDGIPNYLDPTFPGFIDTNGDGVNDNADKDLDGIINQYDLDSDNDGIPDVVESYGVDTNGDGIIDNYTDTDNDGFSQNVDGNSTGVAGSGLGLGAPDFDGDGIPNYLDTDSDNDGIPDVVEAGGSYVANSGRLSNFVDANKDGLSDNNIGATALLKTGPDANGDGRADNFPYKNLDQDFRPNAYDLDSDGDGIVDVIEAGLPDANLDGKADGVIGANGWSTTVSAMPVLTLRNTDGVGNPDYLDIDSDDDGIPDNIEGQSTAGYKLPGTTDTDGDGLVNTYDNIVGFGGSGIFVYDHDSDGIPDYRDLDTDGDGSPDVVEGNDWNLNGIGDENVTLTGLDSDGDGLDDRFDSLNSVTNIKGTSYMMGTGGSLIGDPTPGTKATVQKKTPSQTDRDWRSVGTVLQIEFINFAGVFQLSKVELTWTIITTKDIDHFEIERSTDNSTYNKTGINADPVKLNQQQTFGFIDDVSTVNSDIIYYRIKVIGKAGEIKYSSVLVVRSSMVKTLVNIMPNPAYNYVNINLYGDKNTQGKITMIDKVGRKVLVQNEKFSKGYNNIYLPLEKYSEGIYTIIIENETEKIVKQLVIIR